MHYIPFFAAALQRYYLCFVKKDDSRHVVSSNLTVCRSAADQRILPMIDAECTPEPVISCGGLLIRCHRRLSI